MIKSSRGGFQWRNWDMKSGYKPMQWQPKVSAPSCAYCNKAVYPAEEVIGAGQKFHRFCLKCTTCDASLNTSNMNEHEKKIYCVTCLRQQFGLRGVSRGLQRSSSLNLHTPSTSPDLNKTSYFERKISMGSSVNLHTPPISPDLNKTSQSERKTFISSSVNVHTPPTSPDLNKKSHSERKTSMGSSVNLYTPTICPDLNKKPHFERKTSIGSLQSRSSSDDDTRSTNSHLHKVMFINQVTINNVNSRSSSIIKMLSIPGNKCPRCSKIVYLAEEIRAAGKSFHKRCYSCANCKANINGGRYSEHNGELYDNNCYQRLFGPKGILIIRN